MSHIGSLRSASLRALRTRPNVVVTSKYSTCQNQQQYLYSTLPSSNRNTLIENEKIKKRTLSDQTLSTDSSSNSINPLICQVNTNKNFLNYISVTTPSYPESVKNGKIRLLKQVGDHVSFDEIIAEIETHIKKVTIHAPRAGTIEILFVSNGDNVYSGIEIAKINPSQNVRPKSDKTSNSDEVYVEHTKENKSFKCPIRDTTLIEQTNQINRNKINIKRTETRVPMSKIHLKLVESFRKSQNSSSMLKTFQEIDMSNLMEFLKNQNIKFDFMSIFIKASLSAILENPKVNAVIDGNDIVYRNYVDINVTIVSSKGLVLPVLRNVETMSYADIEQTINYFNEKAKENSLKVENIDSGTFTISNAGTFSTSIINRPQSAILGMHGIFDKPMSVNGKIEIRPMMFVAFTYDHRILDGRDAISFLRKVKQNIEDSRSVFLDL